MSNEPNKHKVICIGAVLVDELYQCFEPVIAATSNPASVTKTAGGVMRNIVHHLVLLGTPVQFITVVGNDADGEWIKNICTTAGIDMSAAHTANCSTGKYAAILNPDGSLHAAAAVNPCEVYLNTELLQQQIQLLLSATIIIADTNLSTEVLSWLIAFCNDKNIMLIIEPVSVSKAKKLAAVYLQGVFMITPNEDELTSLNNEPSTETAIDVLLKRGVKNIWLRKGVHGSVTYSRNKKITLPAPTVKVKDSTGAGDAALAAWASAYCMGMNELECLKAGHAMAAIVLKTDGAIATNTNKQILLNAIKEFYPDEY